MSFSTDKAIFLQMADRLKQEIVMGTYKDNDRIPSVREYSMLLEVNTNTGMKAYEQLAREEIIYNKRGMGYYVVPGAAKKIRDEIRDDFLSHTLPEVFRGMRLLGLTLDDLKQEWEKQ